MPIRRYIRDPFCGLAHLFGSVLSLAGLVALLILAAGRPRHVIAFTVYGLSLVVLYTASGLAHSLHCAPRVGRRLDRFDYAAIFGLIAGTYTPVCLLTLGGAWGWWLLTAEWSLAAVGVTLV